MKRYKLFGMISAIVLLLMLGGFAFAGGAIPDLKDPAAAEAENTFQFRGGIRWDMTPEQVQAAEPQPMIERSQEQWSVMYTQSGVDVSRFHADLVFMFQLRQLKMITYDFGTGKTAADFGYLSGALSAVYGEQAEPEAMEIVNTMDRIYPGYYTEERLNHVQGWTAADGTRIYLYYYAEDAFAVLYVCPDMAQAGREGYVTDGL